MQLSFLSALLSVCSAATVDPSQPSVEISFDRGQEQISLHPPAKPFPEVASHIAALNAKRDALDKAGLEQVRAAFNGQAASFFERTTAAANGPSVRVTAGAVHPVDAAINAEIDALDAQIAGREAAFFKHAVNGIAPQLRASRSSFLQRRVQTKASDALTDANIKIANSKKPWPTVTGLALEMIHTAADSARVTRRAVLNEEAKVLGRAASFVEAEATIPGIVSQVPAEIRGTFGSISEHDLADAISSAVQSVAAELGSDAEEFSCTRQYSDACPEGFTELPSGLCEAPREGRPSGCPGTIDFRGLTPGQKSARAQQCGRRFRCASGSYQSLLESSRGVSAASNDVINIQMEQASLLESTRAITGHSPVLNIVYEHPAEPTHALTASYLDELHGLQERITQFSRRLKGHTAALHQTVAQHDTFNAAAAHAASFLQDAMARKTSAHALSMDVEALSADVISNMTKAIASFQQLQQISRQHAAAAPCTSAADCASLTSRINECTERREAVQQAYEDVNKGVNAMGGAIATLCGCMFVGDSDVCAFKDVSPLCVIPYQSYVGVFESSAAVWDAVKAATEACTVIGAPSVGGSFLELAKDASHRTADAATVYNIVYDGSD